MQAPAGSLRLVPRLAWALAGPDEIALDPRLLDLLDAIAQAGTVTAACAAAGVPYRTAWGLLRDCAARVGAPLATLERGRGASLTPLGAAIVAARARGASRLSRALSLAAVDLNAPLPQARAVQAMRISASHDVAVALLREPAHARILGPSSLAFKGSLEAVQDLAARRADIAGFHVPLGRGATQAWTPFLRWIDPKRVHLVRFADREQGLIVAAGNPHRLRSLQGVAKRGLRFVNRQRGSGTRMLVDALLARAHVAPARVPGYGDEEFTHTAVAAMIASGRADAGFGIRAAAETFGLAFVPVVRERYYFAATDERTLAPLRRVLMSARFRKQVARLPGYDIDAMGEVDRGPRSAGRA